MKSLFFTLAVALGASAARVPSPSKEISNATIVNQVLMVVAREDKDGKIEQLGEITLGLFNKDLPLTTENFEWVCAEHMTKAPFHRVIPGFMAQGGDFTNKNGSGGRSKWGEKFDDESFVYKHDIHALSMANAGVDTNGSQFFITFAKTSWLDGRHVVFGCLTDGAKTLSHIESRGTPSGKTNGTIIVQSCTVSKAPANAKCLVGAPKRVEEF